ncbi:TolC family protein [Massilibacteroides vaginae]|uniref:TolC family protein n=1 Tax=Massilibacteroides vaginae TaxID=1673718 RepID=UPI000A1C9969|nr:TolC family protein [Massilibacteroides vaginae]
MKKYFFFFGFLLLCAKGTAQYRETIKLTPADVEAVFLKQNIQLIAEQMNISMADADILQARLWDNPTLSVGDVNLWTTQGQREGEAEVIPPVFGSFARNTQFSLELSQLIQTANKKGKLVGREIVSREIAVQEFELVLRGLKIELRRAIHEIIYLQNYLGVLSTQQEAISRLITSYRSQLLQGNIAKTEMLRLQSSLLEIENEENETKADLNEQLKIVKSLLCIDPLIRIELIDVEKETIAPESILLTQLVGQTLTGRADIKRSQLQTKFFDKSLAYEKSQRIPDLTFSVAYDRRGGVWRDFVGFGVSMDLPFFNRNQGGIKAAKISRAQSLQLEEQLLNEAQHETVEAYSNYSDAYNFYRKISSDDLLTQLDTMLDVYSKNLLNRNISMVEYIDFMEAYKSNRQTLLMARKKMRMQFEELQYIVGTEITNAL